jgi:glutamate racemase
LELCPSLPITYFGDTARVPYGSKSADTIQKYAVENTRFLLGFNPSLIVVACNSVSALALDHVREAAGRVPVFGVIEPGAELAVKLSKNRRIGVIGTAATVSSGAYDRAILAHDPKIQVFSKACPLFVPFAEEGLFDHRATELIAKDYLHSLLVHDIDTLVLGCTHYPLLKEVIRKTAGYKVTIVDSGQAVGTLVRDHFGANFSEGPGAMPDIYVSDLPLRFQRTAELFLGMQLEAPKKV